MRFEVTYEVTFGALTSTPGASYYSAYTNTLTVAGEGDCVGSHGSVVSGNLVGELVQCGGASHYQNLAYVNITLPVGCDVVAFNAAYSLGSPAAGRTSVYEFDGSSEAVSHNSPLSSPTGGFVDWSPPSWGDVVGATNIGFVVANGAFGTPGSSAFDFIAFTCSFTGATPTPRQIISQAATPTATSTGASVPDTLPTVIPTWTPDSVCPVGANPFGWGYVTPDPLWYLQCGQCIKVPPTLYPTYAPDSAGGGQYNFNHRCAVVIPPNIGDVNPRGDPKTFLMPGLDLGDPECIVFEAWTVSFLDDIVGIEDVGLPQISVCMYPVTFGNLVIFGYLIPLDEILGSLVGFQLLRWLFFRSG